jgi:hypothetical protein
LQKWRVGLQQPKEPPNGGKLHGGELQSHQRSESYYEIAIHTLKMDTVVGSRGTATLPLLGDCVIIILLAVTFKGTSFSRDSARNVAIAKMDRAQSAFRVKM